MKRFIGKIIATAISTALIFSITADVAVEARTPALYEFEPWSGNGTASVQVEKIDSSRFMRIIR